ncbi:Hypothetical protein NTJ_15471 [Nesidiocoris tenuis]|uniref:Exonuclease domain-containing protein n=1 Tax=Nesidiocoris tenuis TaxID=355587 RepID=A0ABN7BHT4_9HEMI|nr:Hypothetical protein NTJ_15471 [Nesidiocoris tenuis]
MKVNVFASIPRTLEFRRSGIPTAAHAHRAAGDVHHLLGALEHFSSVLAGPPVDPHRLPVTRFESSLPDDK